MKSFGKILLAFALAISAPAQLFACAACGSQSTDFKSPMADGMNAGILTLLGVLAPVLACFLFGIVHVIRKSEAAEKAASKSEANPKSEI